MSTTSGCDGCDKYQVCQAQIIIFFTVIAIGILFLHTHKKVVFETQKLSQKCPLVYTGAGASEMFVASEHRFQDGPPISDFIMRILLLTKDFFFLADRGC